MCNTSCFRIACFRLLSLAVLSLITISLATAESVVVTNFVVRAQDGQIDCAKIAARCEKLRLDLLEKWHRPTQTVWSPKCELVIHTSRDRYRDQVGAGSAQTSGSSLIRLAPGGLIHRRIDLLADSDGNLSALLHELTHVVLSDIFQGRRPPPWVDEGIATLEDSEAKRQLHRRDCRDAMDRGEAFRIAELLVLESLTDPGQVPVFYGQSLSLTNFLVDQKEPRGLIKFVQEAQQIGYERAVKKHYGFNSVAELENAWRRFERVAMLNEKRPSGGESPRRMPFREVTGFD